MPRCPISSSTFCCSRYLPFLLISPATPRIPPTAFPTGPSERAEFRNSPMQVLRARALFLMRRPCIFINKQEMQLRDGEHRTLETRNCFKGKRRLMNESMHFDCLLLLQKLSKKSRKTTAYRIRSNNSRVSINNQDKIQFNKIYPPAIIWTR